MIAVADKTTDEMVREYIEGGRTDSALAAKIAENNFGLCVRAAQSCFKSVTDDDVQNAVLGVYFALEHFDAASDATFPTYAYHCMRGCVFRLSERRFDLPVPLGIGMSARRTRIKRLYDEYVSKNCTEPDANIITRLYNKKYGTSVKRNTITAYINTFSVTRKIIGTCSDKGIVKTFDIASHGLTPSEIAEYNDTMQRAVRLSNIVLTRKQRDILWQIINGYKFKELAADIGLSRERVYQQYRTSIGRLGKIMNPNTSKEKMTVKDMMAILGSYPGDMEVYILDSSENSRPVNFVGTGYFDGGDAVVII